MRGIGLACAAVAALLLFPAGAAADSTFNLKFKTLPSAEGWTYASDTFSLPPEAGAFSVSDRVLTQTTHTSPFQSEHYEVPGLNTTKKMTAFMRARVLAEGGNFANNSFGFCFGPMTGTEAFTVGIGTQRIEDIHGTVLSTTIDNTVFPDYLLKVKPGEGYELWVDGELIGAGPPRFLATPNRVIFGDCTNGAGAHAEVTRFQFHQGE
jgi:hypothetical protein